MDEYLVYKESSIVQANTRVSFCCPCYQCKVTRRIFHLHNPFIPLDQDFIIGQKISDRGLSSLFVFNAITVHGRLAARVGH